MHTLLNVAAAVLSFKEAGNGNFFRDLLESLLVLT